MEPVVFYRRSLQVLLSNFSQYFYFSANFQLFFTKNREHDYYQPHSRSFFPYPVLVVENPLDPLLNAHPVGSRHELGEHTSCQPLRSFKVISFSLNLPDHRHQIIVCHVFHVPHPITSISIASFSAFSWSISCIQHVLTKPLN